MSIMESDSDRVSRTLEYLTEVATREIAERQSAIIADHSAKGLLQSGATIRRVIRAAEEVGAQLVSDSVERVSLITKSDDAFGQLTASFDTFWASLAAILQQTVNVASGRHPLDLQEDATYRAADKLFAKSRALVRKKLELSRHSFAGQSPAAVKLASERTAIQEPATTDTRAAIAKKGGRPPAEFWDDLWATIAVALYSGDLKPRTQADIQRAMTDWIESKGHSAADSTIKARARRLWDRIAESEE
jgi:hypothetical protein